MTLLLLQCKVVEYKIQMDYVDWMNIVKPVNSLEINDGKWDYYASFSYIVWQCRFSSHNTP